MELSYQEKSIALSLVATWGIFIYYFVEVFRFFSSGRASDQDLINLFIEVVVLSVVVEVVLQIVLSIGHRPEAKDERDRLIELKATRNAYYLLVLGVWVVIGSVLVVSSPVILVNILVLFFVIGEIAKFASQLFYYRRGI